jgi:hypothetical protein
MDASSPPGGWYILNAETGDPPESEPHGPFASEDEAREVHLNVYKDDPMLVVRWVETPRVEGPYGPSSPTPFDHP